MCWQVIKSKNRELTNSHDSDLLFHCRVQGSWRFAPRTIYFHAVLIWMCSPLLRVRNSPQNHVGLSYMCCSWTLFRRQSNPSVDQLWKFISGINLTIKTSECLHHRTNVNRRKANISVGCAQTLTPDAKRKFIPFITWCQNFICAPNLTFEMNRLLSCISQTWFNMVCGSYSVTQDLLCRHNNVRIQGLKRPQQLQTTFIWCDSALDARTSIAIVKCAWGGKLTTIIVKAECYFHVLKLSQQKVKTETVHPVSSHFSGILYFWISDLILINF